MTEVPTQSIGTRINQDMMSIGTRNQHNFEFRISNFELGRTRAGGSTGAIIDQRNFIDKS